MGPVFREGLSEKVTFKPEPYAMRRSQQRGDYSRLRGWHMQRPQGRSKKEEVV